MFARNQLEGINQIEISQVAYREGFEASGKVHTTRIAELEAALEEHKQGAMEAIRLVGQSARNAGLWQGKAEGLALILTECVNDLEAAINGKVHKESVEKLIAHARQAVDNLNK